ncbi:MAG TPA: glycosyltransferase [Acidimicrobiales bacterium]|nr:glycosyltransferase [Acidimicrobiales bacterium]
MPISEQRVAIVVPTRHEARNVQQLHEQLSAVLTGRHWRIVFVDDSDDETTDVLETMAALDERVTVLHRAAEQRHGGLGSAVKFGIDFVGSAADVVVVMDGDLQHPPPVVLGLLDVLATGGADLAVASRYRGAGSASGLGGATRHLLSRACRTCAHIWLPRSRPVTDPLSGFFAVRREVLQDVQLRPNGYKILLEILERGRWSRAEEVAYEFQPRNEGRSKASFSEGLRFLRHLWLLRWAGGQGAWHDHVLEGEPLRALILTSEAPPVVSGISRTVEMLKEGLVARGHDVDVVSRAEFPRLLFREVRLSSFGLFWPRFRRQLPRYDVINVHGPVPTLTEVFLMLALTLPRHRRPGVVYTHHSDVAISGISTLCLLYNKLVESLAHTADAIVVTSGDYRDKLARAQGAPVYVVPWAVRAPAPRARAPHVPGRARVLFVGQLRPYKGLPQLLSAVNGADELEVSVVGDGPMRPELELRVKREGIDNVRFLGRLEEDALWEAYANADVVVLPSTTTAEAFGLVLMEGMQLGCVPVASDLPGVRHVAAPTGVLVDPGDVESLRAALTGLAADPERLRQLSGASMERASLYRIPHMAERYDHVFRQAAAHVRARQSRAVTPGQYSDPRSFLLDLTKAVAPGTKASIALIDLTAPGLARVWQDDREEAPINEVPLAAYVAKKFKPVLAGPEVDDPELAKLMQDEGLSSSVMVPFRVDRGSVAVVGLRADDDSGVVLRREHLNRTVKLLEAARRGAPLAAKDLNGEA